MKRIWAKVPTSPDHRARFFLNRSQVFLTLSIPFVIVWFELPPYRPAAAAVGGPLLLLCVLFWILSEK